MEFEDVDIIEFPYKGAFYDVTVDEDLPLDQQVDMEVCVFETICDIQKTAKLGNGGLLGASYTVYFPLELNEEATGSIDKYKDVKIRRGMTFRGEAYGYTYEGTVEIVRVSQLGGCSCDIRVKTESDATQA